MEFVVVGEVLHDLLFQRALGNTYPIGEDLKVELEAG